MGDEATTEGTGLADIGHDIADRLAALKDNAVIGVAAESASNVIRALAQPASEG